VTEEKEKTDRKINWTPVIVVGAVGTGVYLILKLFLSENAADREQARIILEDWQQEFDELKPYVETIYYGGRTPSTQEIAILSSMLDQMKIKEETINQLSKSVFTELKDLIESIARNWWLAPVAIITPVAGYMTYKLVKEWKNRRGPPPSFPCPKCGLLYGTEGALKYHVDNEHTPTSAYAIAAQQAFNQTSSWAQNAVAVEGYYGKTFTNWSAWSLSEIKNLNWALTSAWVYMIGAAADSILLKAALMYLLI